MLLSDLDQAEVDCDVLVLGDDREATDVVRALANAIPGVRGVSRADCATPTRSSASRRTSSRSTAATRCTPA
ncbi:hypothetical protein [Actinomycetospora termitidis]|uniref:Uncharacterized protein n=1 Tax=Actinomycetospora termitidis TaxID=3053470 RepID=A0ABT7MI99_9PSEU|nr:hypothetical protein [Actinomycetospora sp. Odt1-22]MDL5159617.1 hypothetical protein [Actinomycetospora sp. Odt1-22]